MLKLIELLALPFQFSRYTPAVYPQYLANHEPMTPAKIKEREPTAVRRDPSELNIVEPGKQKSTTSSQDAAEKARRSGMTKGTAGAADTGSEYEQGAAGSNKQLNRIN